MEDEELIKRAIAGDAGAFEGLVEKHQRRVLSVISRLVPQSDVLDVANETFLHFFRSLESYRGEGSLEGWITRIATRRSYDFWRISWRRREKPVSSLSVESKKFLDHMLGKRAVEDFAQDEESRLAHDIIERLLNDLSPEDRMVITLISLEELPVHEVAIRLGWSKSRVKIRAYRARQKMKELLEKISP